MTRHRSARCGPDTFLHHMHMLVRDDRQPPSPPAGSSARGWPPGLSTVVVAVLVWLGLWAPPCASALTAQVGGEGQEAAIDSAVVPIGVSRFAEEEANTLVLIRQVESQLLGNTEIRELFQDVQHQTGVVDALFDLPESVNPSRYPRRRIESLRAQWTRFEGRLEQWRRTLGDRIDQLEVALRDLDRLRSRFVATDSTLEDGGALELVRLRIQELIGRIDTATQDVAGELAGTIVVQERVVQEQARVTDQILRFDAQLRLVQEQLFRRDTAPLWTLDPAEIMEPATERGRTFEETLDSLRDFLRIYRTKLLLQLAFVAFVALSLLLLRRRNVMPEDEPGLQGARALLEHPIATASIVGLFLTIPMYPTPPIEITEIALLFSVPAILVLLPGIVWPAVRVPLYVISGLFAVDVIVSNLDWVPVLGRTLLLLETLLALSACAWFVRPSSPARDLSKGRWWRTSMYLLRAAAVILALSALANVVGNRSLAEFLTQGAVRGAFAAVVFYAGAIVVGGLITLFPRTEFGSTFRAVRRHGDRIVSRVSNLVHLAALLGWVWAVLRQLTLWDQLVAAVTNLLSDQVGFGPYNVQVGSVALFIFTVWLAFKVSQLTRFILEEEILERLDLPKGVPSTISTLSHWTILGIGLLVAAAAAGIDFSRVTLLAGALSVGIGFGLQNLVNNFVSGMILVFERPIAVGDWVEVGLLTGRVERIGMRSTTVRTVEGAEVIVPNGNLIQNEVTNWTLSDRRRRVDVFVGVQYGTDPDLILRVLLQVAKDHREILAYPEPSALFKGFGDSSLDFALRAWTHTFEDHFRVRSELTVLVNAALKAENVTIPFPQRDLNVKSIPGTSGEGVEINSGGTPSESP